MRTTSQREIRIVTREEEAQIVALLRGTEANRRKSYFNDVADLIEVLVDTGIRMLEAMQLRYSDVDFESNLIIIKMSMGSRGDVKAQVRRYQLRE